MSQSSDFTGGDFGGDDVVHVEALPTGQSESSSGTDSSLAPSGNESEGEYAGFNPAWKPLLEKLPQQFIPVIKEDLSKWDQNYQALQEKSKAFEGYDPNTVGQAMQVWNRIATDPGAVLQVLADQMGVSLQQAQEIVKEEVKEQQQAKMEFTEDDDPRMKTMYEELEAERQQNAEFREYQVQIEHQRLVDQEAQVIGSQMDNQVASLINGGHLPNDQRILSDLMERATLLFERGSKDPIMDAYKQQKNAFEAYSSTVQAPQRPTPLFMPTGGTPPPNNPKGPNLDTAEGRIAFARQIAEASKSS